jgi:hypothetical protein
MKAEFRRHLDEYRLQLIMADLAEIPAIKTEFYKWYNSVSDEDRASMEPFWAEIKKELWEVINETKELIEELRKLNEEEFAETKK